jgi:hypothetical protein
MFGCVFLSKRGDRLSPPLYISNLSQKILLFTSIILCKGTIFFSISAVYAQFFLKVQIYHIDNQKVAKWFLLPAFCRNGVKMFVFVAVKLVF